MNEGAPKDEKIEDASKSEAQINLEIDNLREKIKPHLKTIDAGSWQISEIQKEIEDIKRNPYGGKPKVLNDEDKDLIRKKELDISSIEQHLQGLETRIQPDSERIEELFKLLDSRK